LARFGHFFLIKTETSATSSTLSIQKSLQAALFPLLCHKRAVVRKRATIAIGNLTMTASNELFQEMTLSLLAEIDKRHKDVVTSTDGGEILRTLMSCVTTFW
jgi:hypothetical protein